MYSGSGTNPLGAGGLVNGDGRARPHYRRPTPEEGGMRNLFRRELLGMLAAATVALGAHPSSAQEKNVLKQVLERGTIRIAVQGGVPPYSIINANNEPEGYDIDIGKAIADSLKVKPEWVIVDTPGRITSLQTGKADITIADFTANVERSKVIAFTDPYLVVSMVFTVRAKRGDLKTVEDLNNPNIKVGFGRGSTQEQIVPSVVPK